jgi:hypothetical protein
MILKHGITKKKAVIKYEGQLCSAQDEVRRSTTRVTLVDTSVRPTHIGQRILKLHEYRRRMDAAGDISCRRQCLCIARAAWPWTWGSWENVVVQNAHTGKEICIVTSQYKNNYIYKYKYYNENKLVLSCPPVTGKPRCIFTSSEPAIPRDARRAESTFCHRKN